MRDWEKKPTSQKKAALNENIGDTTPYRLLRK